MVKQNIGTITITIKKQLENYTVEASGPKGIRVEPQPAPQLKALLSDQQITGTLKALSSKTAPATTDAIQKLGKALYDSLFADRELLIAFSKAQGSANSDSNVRLRLQIEPIELATLPWETLHDGKDWLSTQSTIPLVRKLDLPETSKPLQKLQIRGALRILFVGASPEGLDSLEVEKTADNLETLLAESIKKKQIVFDKLLNATLEDLRQELLKDYHILYFAGHGSYKEIFLDDGQGDVIKKEGKVIGREKGDKVPVSAETLAQALKGKQTRLVFLAACETSKAPEGGRLLRGFAQDLAERSNLPAIVAMQYFISDMQANPLTTQFFAALAAGRPVDVAMAEARAVLIKKRQVSRDVFSPVLYLQAEDGALFPKAKNWPAISLGVALLIAVIVGGGFARSAQEKTINTLAQTSEASLLSHRQLEALISAVQSGKQSQNPILFLDTAARQTASAALQEAVYNVQERNRLEGHSSEVTSVVFSPDGKTLASGSDDKTVKLWDVTTGTEIRTLKGYNSSVNSVVFSPNGKTLASGSDDNSVKLWDVTTGTEINTLTGHSDGVTSVVFSPDGKTLASGSDDKSVKLWDVTTSTEIRTLEGHSSRVDSVVFSPDGKTLASGSGDNSVKLWDVTTGKVIHTLNGHDNVVWSVVFSPDGKTLASGSDDKTVKLWDVTTEKQIATLYGHSSRVDSVVFSPDGKTLASSSGDNSVKLWDVTTGKVIHTLKGHSSRVDSVVFSPDGKTLASSSGDNSVKLWDVDTGTEIKTLARLDGDRGAIKSVVFSSDGKTLAAGSDDNSVKLWDVTTGKVIHTLKGHSSRVDSVVFSPDGKTLASGSDDNSVKLWDVTTGTEINTLTGHSDGVTSVVFSPDGKTLASGSGDNSVKLWDVATEKQLATLRGHSHAVYSVAFSPDGKTLASGSGDKTVKLWDVYPNDLNDLMTRSCDELHAYLQNPSVNDQQLDHHLCDGIATQK